MKIPKFLYVINLSHIFACKRHMLYQSHSFSLRGFSVYQTDFVTANRAKGGWAILAHNSICGITVNLRSTLLAVAITITTPHKMIIC